MSWVKNSYQKPWLRWYYWELVSIVTWLLLSSYEILEYYYSPESCWRKCERQIESFNRSFWWGWLARLAGLSLLPTAWSVIMTFWKTIYRLLNDKRALYLYTYILFFRLFLLLWLFWDSLKVRSSREFRESVWSTFRTVSSTVPSSWSAFSKLATSI